VFVYSLKNGRKLKCVVLTVKQKLALVLSVKQEVKCGFDNETVTGSNTKP
jgi:hypothetical protein